MCDGTPCPCNLTEEASDREMRFAAWWLLALCTIIVVVILVVML